MGRRELIDPVARAGYELVVDEEFSGDRLDTSLWFPFYLPHWSSRVGSAPRYRLADGKLHLLIEQDQPPWCPEFDGGIRASCLQTGEFSGSLGSRAGQIRFSADVVVREEQPEVRLFVPQYGFFEMRARVGDDPSGMAALWMVGFEDRPQQSAEICIFEIFGRDVGAGSTAVGMGLHPFGDPSITDDFVRPVLPIDAREFHDYAVEWTPDHVAFFVDSALVTVMEQSPGYPMQFMLGTYAFPAEDGAPPPGPYPKEFVVDRFRGYRRAAA
ncbi:glycosyl hydrolase family protein [Blastococcus sp. CT_GayMR20]|uniref:glycoside hydrolase family 16 protein n=1 Tax=Blastococcus sp. CT_GayMR20 TaxID=2559609 RepID=UPI0010733030|nr:glycoside hydrolase family 16 protein [Blastococcus sp. CT_GayMR20]TFV66135.1 glycosyl hydrolase family protein [Blastococcus sp. CT_GayMR20]